MASTTNVRHAIARSTGATTWPRKDGDEWKTECLNHGGNTTSPSRGAAWKNGSHPQDFCADCSQIAKGKAEKITGDKLEIPATKPTRTRKSTAKPTPTAKGAKSLS